MAKLLGVSVGTCTITVSMLVMLLWIPIRKHLRVGLGTISNALLVGIFVDLWGLVIPVAPNLVWAVVLMVAGIVVNALATALYIVPNFGPGPRDGLMTGLVSATGRPVFLVRSVIEVFVMGLGFLMGGRLFIGTILYALFVGPLTQVFLRMGEGMIGPASPFDSDDA
ncbi:hypothetical protein [uncultured Brevibacterium sp.]|uniref:YczE/YyaS/YitT family protein n=1 Tax=uncultured Brevibacterium sp. TaxID=189678 RepID=UPI0025E5646E|nr:hypothetical protein [uncultured Brevibacterium sp.]